MRVAMAIIDLPWPRQPSPSPLLPFGQTVLSREDYFGREDVGTGAFG